MIMAKRSRTFIRQFTIGLGFLSGVWTAIGIDPEEVLLNLLGTVTGEVLPDPTVKYLFLVIPSILLLFSARGAYKKGKILGLASVFAAYIAGLSVLIALWTSLFLLALAVATGCLAARYRPF